MNAIHKAVIPAAGYGTRMLPITKAVSKEMLPIVDTPVIQFVVEELMEAGIDDIIIVTAPHKTDLQRYFEPTSEDLAVRLRPGSPADQSLRRIEAIQQAVRIRFIEQTGGLYGTGVPVLCAEPYLDGEPFIYTFADDFFVSQENSYRQLLAAYTRHQAPVVACQRRTQDEDYSRYAYMGGAELAPGEVLIRSIIEKPGKADAPGDLASIGGFIVTPDMLSYLRRVQAVLPAGKELFFNSAFDPMLADGQCIIAKEIVGADYYDTGNNLEYVKTVIDIALRRPDMQAELREYLRKKLA